MCGLHNMVLECWHQQWRADLEGGLHKLDGLPQAVGDAAAQGIPQGHALHVHGALPLLVLLGRPLLVEVPQGQHIALHACTPAGQA